MTEACCDIVIPVFNALDAVLDLLYSLARFTSYPHRVILIDDCSLPFVGQVLTDWCQTRSNYCYVRNEANAGYLKTVNRAIELTSSEYICVLNSDTVVTAYWLERMVSVAQRDPMVAVVNPATNNAPVVALPFAPGYSIYMMAQRLGELNSDREAIEVVTGVGFCWLLRRDIIQRFGIFDEAYSPGYCEEADYAMRVRAAGYKIVVAVNSFVFHRGSTSFAERGGAIYLKNRKVFDHRWKAVFKQADAQYRRNDPLTTSREALFEGTIPALDLIGASEIKSKLHTGWNLLSRGEFRIFANGVQDTVYDIARHWEAVALSPGTGRGAAAQDSFGCPNISRLAAKTFFPEAAYVASVAFLKLELYIMPRALSRYMSR